MVSGTYCVERKSGEAGRPGSSTCHLAPVTAQIERDLVELLYGLVESVQNLVRENARLRLRVRAVEVQQSRVAGSQPTAFSGRARPAMEAR